MQQTLNIPTALTVEPTSRLKFRANRESESQERGDGIQNEKNTRIEQSKACLAKEAIGQASSEEMNRLLQWGALREQTVKKTGVHARIKHVHRKVITRPSAVTTADT